jgi:RNA polymerase sigma factor (TIGR02999 family)
MSTSSTEISRVLKAVGDGEPEAAHRLLPLVYDELRKLAAGRLSAEAHGQTLQPTALVHEAWLRLVGESGESEWDNRGHFFAAAAEAMRRILIDNARHKKSEKHGGRAQREELIDVSGAATLAADDLLDLDSALTAFESVDPKKAELVKLRYFAGLSEAEAAAALGVSRPTAARWWLYARAWLFDRLGAP